MKPLNPIMAVLVIASVGATPLRARAADGEVKSVAVATDEKNPINALEAILKDPAQPEARKDAGARMKEFVFKAFVYKGEARSFIADELKTEQLGQTAVAWGEKEASADQVAVLYFVIGPGSATPEWAKKNTLLSKTFKPGMKWTERLREALAAEDNPDWTGKHQIRGEGIPERINGFLIDASSRAAGVFADQRTKSELDASIIANDVTAPVVPAAGNAASRNPFARRQYTLDDLYVDGAVVKDVSGPDDPNSRTISMKIYTRRMPDGSLVNEVGIFDITDRPEDVFGQRFPIKAGETSFVLDDRTPGHKKYELKFGPPDESGNREVTLARPGGGVALTTSVGALFLTRADQAEKMGNIISVNGQEFYALPQGGAKSAMALFPKALIDGRSLADGANLKPQLYSEIGMRGDNGENRNAESGDNNGPMLGSVGGKDYHLEFNKTLGVWEVKEGAGYPPPVPVQEASGGDAANGGANGGNAGQARTYQGIVDALIGEGKGKCRTDSKFADDMKEMRADLRGKYGLVTCRLDADGFTAAVIVPPSALTPGQQVVFGRVAKDGDHAEMQLVRARIVDHFLVLQYDAQVQYLDLLQPTKGAFKLVGFVAGKSAGGSEERGFYDMGIFVDALRNYMGIAAGSNDAKAFVEVPKRVAEVLKGKTARMSASYANEALTVQAVSGGRGIGIWPEIDMGADAPAADSTPYAGLSGPTNAMDRETSVSSDNASFEEKFETLDKRWAKLVPGRKSEDIAMYESEDPIGKDKDKKYYLMLRFKEAAASGDPVIFRQKAFEVFNSTSPLPSDLHIKGLLSAAAVKNRTAMGYGFIEKSTKDKGVLAAFQEKQSRGANQQNAAANCVGPIAWWGVSEADALAACKADKL